MSSLLTLVSVSGLFDLALKSAAVMLLAVVVAALLGRASAAWRHLVWCLAVVSLLLLPVLSLALPAWQVGSLPQWTAALVRLTTTATAPTLTQVDPIDPVGPAPPLTMAEPLPLAPSTTADTSPLPVTNVETVRPPRSPWPWLAIAWAVGTLLSFVPLAVGLWQLAALHRRSRAIDDRRWMSMLAELRRQLCVRRSVQLRQCKAALAPFTWGGLRPVLMVPAESSTWSDERRRLVLMHELAHVRRWDWLTQLLAHVACALYWFNPLVWFAARQMRIERERACDDLVLSCGARPSDYAQELLASAAELSKLQMSALVAVPMARRGMLEDRLAGILDSRRSRAALTTAAVCLGAALAAAAIAPLAMLRAAPPESAESKTEERKQEPSMNKQPAAEKPAEKPGEAAAATQKELLEEIKRENGAQQNSLLGKEAAERVKLFPPSFSKAQDGIEVGIVIASDRKAFHEGERVPLEFVVRNVSQKTLLVDHALYPPETPPTVIGPDGKQLSIERVTLFGANRRYRDTLKPNEAAVYRHPGLGLGKNPNPGTFWNPFLNDAVPGRYRLSQQAHITVREEGDEAGGKSFRAASGEVAFAIAVAAAPDVVTGSATRIIGRITDPAGKPLAGQQIVAAVLPPPPKRAPKPGRRMEWKLAGEVPPSATSDEEGRFTIDKADARATIMLQFYGAELQQPRKWQPKGSLATTISLKVAEKESELEVGYVPRNMTSKVSTVDGRITREVAITWSPTKIMVHWGYAPTIEKWKESRTMAEARDPRWKDGMLATDETVWVVPPGPYEYDEHNQHVDLGSALQLGTSWGQGLRADSEKEIILFFGALDPRMKPPAKP